MGDAEGQVRRRQRIEPGEVGPAPGGDDEGQGTGEQPSGLPVDVAWLFLLTS